MNRSHLNLPQYVHSLATLPFAALTFVTPAAHAGPISVSPQWYKIIGRQWLITCRPPAWVLGKGGEGR
ncbi:MAG: hypothetical protein M0Z50_05115 [Planctomycetia bacterium]|nr:hypothetical protein [Planctomycetia bacterium]